VGTRDERRRFDEIVADIAAEDPTFADPPLRRRSRPARAVLVVIGAATWGMLSVLMVVWGWAGVALTCVAVGGTAAAFGLRRRRSHRKSASRLDPGQAAG
jgi:hypothetical protein